MKTCLLAAVVVLGLVRVASAEEEAGFPRFYVGVSASGVIPQGGGGRSTLGGAALRGGYYVTESFAGEGEVAWLEDACALTAQGLWHLHGWDVYDRLFGYSRFDPFLTGGVKGWMGRRDGQVGPKVGFGAFYYLSDAWAIRGDADAVLGLNGETCVDYSLAIGLQYSF